MGIRAFTVTSLVFSMLLGGLAEQCGWQANGALCPNGLCCSSWGFCGSADPWCGEGCQSQCDGDGGDDGDVDLESIIPKSTFEQMLVHSNSTVCPARGFYTYEAFIKAAKAFPDFGTHGDNATRKREIAAFFGQTSFETSVIGWEHMPDGPYSWGYCYIRDVGCRSHCSPSDIFPCAPGKRYCGRGPIQLTGNYNYGLGGQALGVDLLNNPELVETDPVLAFKTSIWFWMTPQFPKPSCHDVITGKWIPSARDLSEGRVPGYGVITNIINGASECGRGTNRWVSNRIGFYKRYCDILGVDYGDNLDCFNQRPFISRLLVDTI